MHKLTFTLKQHTPLIHFQPDQQGATLRASEVKPRLDRFIIEKLGSGDYKAGAKIAHTNNWLIKGAEYPALDYKMRINSSGHTLFVIASRLIKNQPLLLQLKGYSTIAPSPYFSQEKEISDLFEKADPEDANSDFKFKDDIDKRLNELDKKGIHSNNIECRAFSFLPQLLIEINKYICEFFIYENFGCRQSKGFGSFTVEYINKILCDIDHEKRLKDQFKFVFKKNIDYHNLSLLFKQIQEDYKLLKSGQNSPYAKSKLFLHHLPIRWEKRKIKQDINSDPITLTVGAITGSVQLKSNHPPVLDENNSNAWDDPNDDLKYRYIRVLLGLTDQMEFLADFNLTSGYGRIPKVKYFIQIKSRNSFERYRSPILFKVINNTIYMVGNDVNSELLSTPQNQKYFDFTAKVKVNEKLQDTPIRTLTPLSTPYSFDLLTFIDFALANENDKKISDYRRLKPEPEKDM